MSMSTFDEQRREAGGQASQGAAPQPGAVPPMPPPYAVPGTPPPPGWAGTWKPARDSRRKSVALAYFLSFIMPGLGQVYVGYYQRGFLHAIIFGGIIALLSTGSVRGLEPLFGIFLGFFYLYNIVDAGRRASFYNMALDGLQPMPFPEDFKLPSGGGSLVGGLILTAIGLLLFLNLRFDFDLDWLVEWWPLLLVALGLNLIYKATRSRPKP
jgi:hypothetical protein